MSTEIIVLIILFNVATAFYKHRAKKKKEMEAREASLRSNAGSISTASTSTPEMTSQKREPPSWASDHERDEVEQDWDETNQSEYDEEESENSYRETPQTKPLPAKPASPSPISTGPVQNQDRGKDLLTQLARELGLEIPPQRAPSPTPAPTGLSLPKIPSNRTESSSSNERMAAKVAAAETVRYNRAKAGYDDHDRTVADSDPGKDMTSAPGIAAVESANASAYATRERGRNAIPTGIHGDLFDAESLQRAFILKTVLDPPLSIKARSPRHGDSA